MKYRVTLNNKTYEIEVERGNAILKAEYDAKKHNFAKFQEKQVDVAPVPVTEVKKDIPEETSVPEKEE